MKPKNYTGKNMLEAYLREMIKEELDKTPALSNLRRKKFRQKFKMKEVVGPALGEQPDPNAPSNDTSSASPSTPNSDGGVTGPTAPTGTADANKPGSSSEPDEQNAASKNPVDDIVNSAQELTKTTRNVPDILKVVKSKMQDNYKQIGSARDVVKALHDTKDSTLQGVAARLDDFLRAGNKTQ